MNAVLELQRVLARSLRKPHGVPTWADAEPPWVLHAAPLLANPTERWIDIQACSRRTYDSRLLGSDVDRGDRAAHWLVAADRPDLWLAYRAMLKTRGISPLWLAPRFRGNPPTVLHAHYGTIGAGILMLGRALRAPVVVSFYGFDATKRDYVESRMWRRRYERMFASSAAVLAEGPKMADRIAGLGCPEKKIRVVRLPADADGLAGCERREPRDFVVVAAARWVEKKGFDVAIRAFARAFRGRRGARLLMIGGGPLEHALKRLAANEGIADQVEWRGLLPFRDFMNGVGEASVALFPSRESADGDSEGGAPVTLIESQWLGVPALVSDHDDLPFVAAPKGSIVLPPLNVEEWAECLHSLYDERETLETMGAAATAFARAHHSPATNAAAREAVYSSVSHGKAP